MNKKLLLFAGLFAAVGFISGCSKKSCDRKGDKKEMRHMKKDMKKKGTYRRDERRPHFGK